MTFGISGHSARGIPRYQGAEFTDCSLSMRPARLRPEQMTFLASRIRKDRGIDLPLQLRLRQQSWRHCAATGCGTEVCQ